MGNGGKMKNSKGSFTVEAAMVFSVVFLMVTVLVYVFIIMYQYVTIQSIANEVATKGAYYYVNQNGEDYGSYKIDQLYWRVNDTKKDQKNSAIVDYVKKFLNQSVFPTENNVYANTHNELLFKRLEIDIEEQYPLPVGSLFDIFGLSPILSLKARSNSPLDDNAEFMRNMDTVTDIQNCILNGDNKWIGKDSKVGDILDKLLKKN